MKIIPLSTKISNHIPLIDRWVCEGSSNILISVKNNIRMPISESSGHTSASKGLDLFNMSPSRCYNKDMIKDHICKYVNYFLEYFDKEHELLSLYSRFKLMIDDCVINNGIKVDFSDYTESMLIDDIKSFILSGSIAAKVRALNEHNFILEVREKLNQDEALIYKKVHIKALMEISFLMNITIPILSHYVFVKKISNQAHMNSIIMSIFRYLFDRYPGIDLYSKLHETISSILEGHFTKHKGLWNICRIRGIDPTISAVECITIVILQVMPKYKYNNNPVVYNLSSIKLIIKCCIETQYEYGFTSLSMSKREGEDSSSQFDKYEAYLSKTNESLVILNSFCANKTMEILNEKYSYLLSEEKVDYYIHELKRGGKIVINPFQMYLIFNQFYKYFGEPNSMQSIDNIRSYAKLMIIGKEILKDQGFIILPEILGGRINRIVSRTNINNKELSKIKASEHYRQLEIKYASNEKIYKQILNDIGIFLSSDFSLIDYDTKPIKDIKINVIPDIIIDEYLLFVLSI